MTEKPFPTTFFIANREPQEIQCEKIKNARSRSFSDAELCEAFAARRGPNQKTAEPGNDCERQEQETLIGKSLGIREKNRQPKRQLKEQSAESWNRDPCHVS